MSKKAKIAIDRLPLYEMVMNEEDDTTGVRYISIVENPAIQMRGKAFGDHVKMGRGNADAVGYQPPCHDNCQCEIVGYGYNAEWQVGANPCDFCLANKEFFEDANLRFNEHKFTIDVEQKCIVGPAMIPNKQIYRNDEDGEYMCVFSPATIINAMKKFTKLNSNRAINLEHSDVMVNAYVMQSWIVKNATYDAAKAYGYDVPVGTWMIVMQIEDEDFWQTQVKELSKCSFSIEGILGMKLVRMSEDVSVESVYDTLTDEELTFILK